MMACSHKFKPCDKANYERCELCGTYHSLGALLPQEIYGHDYWSDRWGHGTIRDQNYNVEKHTERGVTKNDFVINLIWTQDRSAALEIACAPGSLLRRLKDQFERIVGIEVDAAYEKDIRDMAFPEVELIFGYFPEATKDLGSESFSLVLGLDIFEHDHAPEAFLSECARLLKPDGQLLLMTPIMSQKAEMPDRFFHPIEHVFIHSYQNLFNMLVDAGFASINSGRWTEGHETIAARKL